MVLGHKLTVLVTAKLSDYKLRTKLIGLLENERIGKVLLVRRFPMQPGHSKLENINPQGFFASSRLLYELWRAWKMGRLARERVDLVVGIQLLLHGVQAVVAGLLGGRPAVVSVIGSDVHIHLASRWKRPLLGWALRHASASTVMGPESRRKLSEAGVTRSRMFEIQNFQAAERFQPREEPPRYDLVYIGHLIPRKRVDALLAAVKDVSQTVPGVRLAIVGDGPLRSQLETMARSLAPNARVDFVGQQGAVEHYLNASRVFVLVSRIEALPAAAIEAMYCGIPAVLTSVCDIPGLFVDGENALLVPMGDHEALVAALCRILTEPGLYHRLRGSALAARKRHMKMWGVEGQVKRWNDILDAVCLSRMPSS